MVGSKPQDVLYWNLSGVIYPITEVLDRKSITIIPYISAYVEDEVDRLTHELFRHRRVFNSDFTEKELRHARNLASLCGGCRWLAVTGYGTCKTNLPLKRTIMAAASNRLAALVQEGSISSLESRVRQVQETYYWLEILVLLGSLSEWRRKSDLCTALGALLSESSPTLDSVDPKKSDLWVHVFTLKLFCFRLLLGPSWLDLVSDNVNATLEKAIRRLTLKPKMRETTPSSTFNWQTLINQYDVFCMTYLRDPLQAFEKHLILNPGFDIDYVDAEPSELLMHQISNLREELLTTPLSQVFLNIERHRLTGTFNKAAYTPYAEVVKWASLKLFEPLEPTTVRSTATLRRRMKHHSLTHLRWIGEAAIVLHSLITWYQFERVESRSDRQEQETASPPGGAAPLLYYPFWTQVPQTPLAGVPEEMRFRASKYEAWQAVPETLCRGSNLLILDELEPLKEIAEGLRDRKTGFFLFSPRGPLSDFADVAQFVYRCKLMGALDWIEKTTDLRWSEVSSTLMRQLLDTEHDILVDASEDKVWTLADVCGALSTIFMTGHIEMLYGDQRVERLARAIASLQSKEGHFLPAYGESPAIVKVPCPLWATLCGLISLSILHSTACPGTLALISVNSLRDYLSTDKHYLNARCCGQRLNPDWTISESLRGVYLAMACWNITKDAYGLAIPKDVSEKAMCRVMKILGVPLEVQRKAVGIEERTFLEVLAQLAEKKGRVPLAGRTKNFKETSTLPSSEYFYGLGALSAAGVSSWILASVFEWLASLVMKGGRGKMRGYLPLYCTLPFVLRELPLIQLTTGVPALSFQGGPALRLKPINIGSLPLRNVKFGTMTGMESSFLYIDEHGFEHCFGRLKQRRALARVEPGGYGASIADIEFEKRYEMRQVCERTKWNGYGASQTTQIGFRCSVDLSGRTLDFSAALPGTPVLFLPARSKVEEIVRNAMRNADYHEPTAVASVQRWLKNNMETGNTHEAARWLVHDFYASRFELWIKQFDPRERPFAEQLYNAVKVYTIQDMYELALRCLKQLPPSALRAPSIHPLAMNLGQSGVHVLYYFRYALRLLRQAIKTGQVFPALIGHMINHTDTPVSREQQTIIFVDDFIGINGTQAKRYLGQLINKVTGTPRKVPIVYYLGLVGFESGRRSIERWALNEFQRQPRVEVKLADEITEADRPFSATSKVFKTTTERERAREMVIRIGRSVLPYTDEYNTLKDDNEKVLERGDRARRIHALGWEQSQALVVFPHNVPNNTLPIIWANGSYKDTPWMPLFPRK